MREGTRRGRWEEKKREGDRKRGKQKLIFHSDKLHQPGRVNAKQLHRS